MPRWLGGEARRLSLPAGVQPWTSGWEGAWRLVQEDEQGRIVAHTGLQMPGVMDAVLAPHVGDAPLGFSWRKRPGLKPGLGHASQPETPYTADLLPPAGAVRTDLVCEPSSGLAWLVRRGTLGPLTGRGGPIVASSWVGLRMRNAAVGQASRPLRQGIMPGRSGR